jgi:dCMP deaminase
MKMAMLVAERSTCLRRQVGAVLVKNNQVIASGYNGSPKHILHCNSTGCMREKLNVPSGEKHELCRGVHAEQNTIIQAALNGTSLVNSVLYCTNFPCSICAKMIINAEINEVYVLENYPDDLAKEMFAEAGTEVILIDMKEKSLKKIV